MDYSRNCPLFNNSDHFLDSRLEITVLLMVDGEMADMVAQGHLRYFMLASSPVVSGWWAVSPGYCPVSLV